jgi:AcrR family transcriptional regulator
VARPRESTDDELLDRVGQTLSARTSLARWSLADVSAGAGVAPATLVKRFGSRQGLLAALSRRWIDEIPTAPPAGRPAMTALDEWVEKAFSPADSQSAAVVGMQFLVEDLADAELRTLLRQGFQRQIDYLAQLLEAGNLARLGSPVEAAALLFDSLNGALLRSAAGDPAARRPGRTLERLLEAWS